MTELETEAWPYNIPSRLLEDVPVFGEGHFVGHLESSLNPLRAGSSSCPLMLLTFSFHQGDVGLSVP
jgi:hypothetical protein